MRRANLFLTFACLCCALLYSNGAQEGASRSGGYPTDRKNRSQNPSGLQADEAEFTSSINNHIHTVVTPRGSSKFLHRQAQVIEQSGDINALFSRIKYLQKDSNKYRLPTQQDLDVWRQAVAATLGGDLDSAARLLQGLAPSYKVIKFTDTSGVQPRLYFLLIEAIVTPTDIDPGVNAVVTGWGSYFFDPAPARELVIEIPHPLADVNTQNEGILALTQLRPRGLLLFGSHRCASDENSSCGGTNDLCGANRASDASHGARLNSPGVTNTFQVAHEELLKFSKQSIAVQLHGNITGTSDVLVSNTGSDFKVITDGNVSRLKASFDRTFAGTDLTTDICNREGAGGLNLCGTANLQGRWTNGSPDCCQTAMPAPVSVERFIHVEQSGRMREDAGNRQRLVSAIAATQFVLPSLGSTVQFSQVSYTASETPQPGGDTKVIVTVTRTGSASDLAQAASVFYKTLDGTAKETTDYTTAAGTIMFAAGETSKAFTVLITDDRFAEGDESFSVTLSNPIGASLGTPATSAVVITDNDASSGPSPVSWDASFDTSFFVRQHYHDFLNREPDATGLQFWVNNIESCGTDTPCREVKRVNVSAAFFLSIEFQGTGNLVYKMYKTSFGNLPNKPVAVQRANFIADTRQVGSTPAQVIVGQPEWEQQLETNKQAFALAFVQRTAFQQAHGSQDKNAFVNSLFANAGATPTSAETSAAVNAFNNAAASGIAAQQAAALRSVAESNSVSLKVSNESFVLMQYFGYLQRDPDATPDSDFSGYNFWLSKLNQFNGNFVAAEMVKAFITSFEYRGRFGNP